MYSPYYGYAVASGIPDYFNPYKAYTNAGNSMQQAQQAAQAAVPNKDVPTPGSKHGKLSKKVKMRAADGTISEVSPYYVQHYLNKGARRVS